MTRVVESPTLLTRTFSFLGTARPFFFQLTSSFKPLTLQVNLMSSPARIVGYELSTITAVGFPNIRGKS